MYNVNRVFNIDDEVLRMTLYLQNKNSQAYPDLIQAFLKVFIPLYRKVDILDVRDSLNRLVNQGLVERDVDRYRVVMSVASGYIRYKEHDQIIFVQEKNYELEGEVLHECGGSSKIMVKDINGVKKDVYKMMVKTFSRINGYKEEVW